MTHETKDDFTCENLGSLQEKVLFFLAENPEKHKQGIQKGINHPADQYGSIVKAVDALERMKLVKADYAKSQKNVEIKIYSCTESGIFYTLTRNPIVEVTKILDIYENKVDFCKPFKELYNLWGHDNFLTYMKETSIMLPYVQKHGFAKTIPHMLLFAAEQNPTITTETRKKNALEAFRLFPETKKVLQNIKKDIDGLL